MARILEFIIPLFFVIGVSTRPDFETNLAVGVELMTNGSHREAATKFLDAIVLRPTTPEVWAYAGAALDAAGHVGVASKAYVRAAVLCLADENEAATKVSCTCEFSIVAVAHRG